jgi:hypothetical protein
MIRAWAAHDADLFRGFAKLLGSTGLIASSACASARHRLRPQRADDALPIRRIKVTGLDAQMPELWGLGWSLDRYRTLRKTASWPRVARKFMGELVYDRLYYQELAKQTGLRLSATDLDVRRLDATRLPLPDQSADLVHSNATWEHILDVPAANREVARVLKVGGVAAIEIHLFPSISGGHDLPWKVPASISATYALGATCETQAGARTYAPGCASRTIGRLSKALRIDREGVAHGAQGQID